MKLIPLFDRILVRPVPIAKTQTGVYLPQNTTEKTQVMEVVAVGDGECETLKVNMKIGVGDRVIICKYAGTQVELDGEAHYILKQCDVLGIVGYSQPIG